MSRYILRSLAPKSAVKGRLGRDSVRYLGVQGIRPPPQAYQDLAPAGGVPEGLGEGDGLGAGRPLGGNNLPDRDALAYQDTHPPNPQVNF